MMSVCTLQGAHVSRSPTRAADVSKLESAEIQGEGGVAGYQRTCGVPTLSFPHTETWLHGSGWTTYIGARDVGSLPGAGVSERFCCDDWVAV